MVRRVLAKARVVSAKRCRHCGQLIFPKIRFGGSRGVIYKAIRESEIPPSAKDLANIVYASDPNGGPLYAVQSIQVAIHHMNKRLRPRGLEISSHSRGYELREIAQHVNTQTSCELAP